MRTSTNIPRKRQPYHINTPERIAMRNLIASGTNSPERELSDAEAILAKGHVIDAHHFHMAVSRQKYHLIPLFLKNAISQLGATGTADMIIRLPKDDEGSGVFGADGPYTHALHLVVQRGHLHSLGHILNVLDTANINLRETPYCENLIAYAVALEMSNAETQDRKACIQMLLARGLDVNVPNMHGTYPVHEVCSADMTRFLVSNGADLRAKDSRGNRALHTLWLRRRTMRYIASQAPSRHAAFMETALTMLELGAQIKDSPPLDILRMDVSDHPISGFLIAGRQREALMKVAGRIGGQDAPTQPQVVPEQAQSRTRRPQM